MPTTSLTPGDTVGRYRIDAVLGSGGFGAVFRATMDGPMGFRKAVAIKSIHPWLVADNPGFLHALIDEARLGGLLRHPNVVETYELVQEGDRWLLVMEYVRGVTLEQLLERCAATRTTLPIAMVLEAGEQICRGLHHAHRRKDEHGALLGIVHRDLKPSNLMLTPGGVVKVVDFGIAKAATKLHRTTRTGQAKGTPAYMSPEQIQGKKSLGPASDLFSLGAVLYELTTGERLFDGELWSILHDVLGRDLTPALDRIEGISPPLAAVLGRCLAREPQSRWPSARELGGALRSLRIERGDPELLPVLASLMLTPSEESAFHQRSTSTPGLPLDAVDFLDTFLHDGPQDWPPGNLASNTDAPSERAADTAADWVSDPGPVATEPDPALDALHPPEPPRPRPASPPPAEPHRRRLLPALAIGGVTLAAAAFWYGLERSAPPVPAEPRAPAVPFQGVTEGLTPCPTSEPTPLLRQGLGRAVPNDVRSVLGEQAGSFVLEGMGGYYLLSADEGAAPTRVELAEDEAILGAGEEGLIWLRHGASILARRPLEGKEAPWVTTLPRALAAAPATELAISPSGHHLALSSSERLELWTLEDGEARRGGRVPWSPDGRASFSLSDAHLVTGRPGDGVRVYALPDGQQLAHWESEAPSFHALAIQDESGWVAAGGWFDSVEIYRVGEAELVAAVPQRARSYSLAWIPDHPTLVAGGEGGLWLWRPDQGVIARHEVSDGDVHHVAMRQLALTALDGRNHQLELHAYQGIPCLRRQALGTRELWAVAADPAERWIFAGGEDGILYRVALGEPPPGERVRSFELHTAGLTSLATDGEHLATASDDHTIATWRLPELRVEWRTKAHEYLVNQLYLDVDSSRLWSSSSDGTARRWSWPELGLEENLPAQQLVGEQTSLAAIWASPEGDRVFAGTWNHAVVDIRQDAAGRWDAQRLPIPSRAAYDLAWIPRARALLVVGIFPTHVYLFDLDTARLHELRHLGLSTGGGGETIDGEGAWVLGSAALLHYGVAREADGALRYEVRAARHSELGHLTSLDLLQGGDELAVGNHRGELLLLDALPSMGPPLWSERLEP